MVTLPIKELEVVEATRSRSVTMVTYDVSQNFPLVIKTSPKTSTYKRSQSTGQLNNGNFFVTIITKNNFKY